jgi:hypothetical protein
MDTAPERHEAFNHERRVLREAVPDACDGDRCLRVGAHGMDPCFPVSWVVQGDSVTAHYFCARCRKNWRC